MNGLIVSVVLLWIAVLALAVLVWALSRQVGVLFERVAPMGALVTDAGPPIGHASPQFELRTLQGGMARIGGTQERATLIFFLAPTCPVCKKLLPVLRSVVRDEGRRLQLVLASDGAANEHREFVNREQLDDLPYVLSQELGMTFRVNRLPYAVLLDPQGLVSAKGLVNSREQLDSLLNAQDLRIPTIQQFLARPAA